MNTKKLVSIYNRTYNNCKFYYQNNDNKHLLNEIGTLRGVLYCIGEIIGEGKINRVIDFQKFAEMINKQEELLKQQIEKEK